MKTSHGDLNRTFSVVIRHRLSVCCGGFFVCIAVSITRTIVIYKTIYLQQTAGGKEIDKTRDGNENGQQTVESLVVSRPNRGECWFRGTTICPPRRRSPTFSRFRRRRRPRVGRPPPSFGRWRYVSRHWTRYQAPSSSGAVGSTWSLTPSTRSTWSPPRFEASTAFCV